jgi:hypothetical protein
MSTSHSQYNKRHIAPIRGEFDVSGDEAAGEGCAELSRCLACRWGKPSAASNDVGGEYPGKLFSSGQISDVINGDVQGHQAIAAGPGYFPRTVDATVARRKLAVRSTCRQGPISEF